MVQNQNHWLSHLVEAIPYEAQRNRISMYTIALEGWRRGLTLKFLSYNNRGKMDIKYSLSNKEKEHQFIGSGGDLNTAEAVSLCDDKELTKQHLMEAGLSVPRGKRFNKESSEEEIVRFSHSIKFPVVLKPTDGSGGKGVFVNLQDEMELKEALIHTRTKLGYADIIVEQFVAGEEVRVFVLEDKVLGVTQRMPANVVGDGERTIRQLVDDKNHKRKSVPHLHFRPIKIDAEVKRTLKKSGFSLDSVLKTGKRVFVRMTSNISTGGDPIEVTQQLTSAQKNTAINAVKSISGLSHCGIDMIIDKESNKGFILEINTRAGLGSHLFPIEGQAKDIPKKIIDFYFPETSKISTEKANVYFDFKTILDALEGRTVKEIEVEKPVKNHLVAKRFSISSELDPAGYYKWLQKKVFEQELNGFIARVDKDNIEIVIAGQSQQALDQFYEILKHGSLKSLISNILEQEWKLPIMLGFQLVDGSHSMSLRELETAVQDTKKQLFLIEKEKKRLEQYINRITNSSIWKATLPLRNVGNRIRKLRKTTD
ncbi:sugar-transfer associated ATP-grasp domain-containing protein [Shouchella shacheensis]|uniref:ATP-binding protein n=1 Tax=Shouchella shacheensis TaxID=1649580 RepID=UPI0007400C76|nr:sugar-transfer associated ATP-grasp domain-containing protein [Shouchella shacheensis]